MRLASVLEPSVVHATADQWHDDRFAREFERRWLEVVDGFASATQCDCDHAAVASEEFLALMFDSQTQPAWMADRGARQRFMPLLYQRLWPMLRQVSVSSASTASAAPPVDDRRPDDPWLTSTLATTAWATEQADETVLHLGVGAFSIESTVVSTATGSSAVVACCSDRLSFLEHLPLAEMVGRGAMVQLPHLFAIACELFVAANPGREIRYEVEFAPSFVKMVTDAPVEVKTRVLPALVSRATLKQKEAQADKGLKDEPLHDRANRRRMRVSRDWRIHYSYIDGPGICFETLGPHDLGL